MNDNEHEGRRNIARHEAGHAVVAWALDLPFTRIEIRADCVIGRTKVTGTLFLPPEQQPRPDEVLPYRRKLIAYAVAGEIAERDEWTGRTPSGRLTEDAGYAMRVAHEVDAQNMDAVIAEATVTARQLLRQYAVEHERLTDAIGRRLAAEPASEHTVVTVERPEILAVLEGP